MTEYLRPRIVAKLEAMADRVGELTASMADPELLANHERMRVLQKELGQLQRVAARFERYRKLVVQIADNRSLLEPAADGAGDAELAELAAAELPELERQAREAADQIVDGLLAEAGHGDRDAIVEVRAGTGGEEAALFARDLFEIYQRYCELMGWKTDLISESRTDMDGFKEVVFSVSGDDVFGKLRFESGGHRVQRVPATESQGRIHTSAATVAVLPEVEEVEVDLKEADIDFQAVRASGPGGQNVNKVSSAVRLTHRPSGLVVFCQEERSQIKNKQKAMKLLRSRLYDSQLQKVESERAAARRSQVGTGDRNARVRTYNFPQNRVTDHRINQNFSLEQILEGKLGAVHAALQADEREKRLDDL